MSIAQLLDHQAETRPDAPAIRDADDRRWTYDQLSRETDTIAGQLRDRGTRPGDRVLILAENCAEAVAALFAAARIGAWAIPVNARLTATEIDRIVTHATPRAVILTTGASPNAADHANRLGARRQGRIAIGTLHDSAPEADRDVAVLLYTTGTTGTPKGVMLTHDNLRFGGHASATLRGMVPGDTIYGALPITHVFGLASMVMAGIGVGACLRLERRFDPARLHVALQDDVTVLPAVPQMHALLMAHVGDARLTGTRLRYVSSGAAPLDPAWKRKAEAFYGLPLQNGYGMTETTAGICATQNEIGDPDISVGGPLPGIEVRIDEGVPGGDGSGEILTRGPHVMRGYYKAPDLTAEALQDGWMRTGDLGHIDAEGRLHVTGRAKELIIRGGFNVLPPEVEAALNDHSDVIQCAVIGRAVDGHEEVLAFAQIRPGADLTEAMLKNFAADRLAPYKRPARIILADALPAAPTGKILKHKLLDHFADRLS
ncbi:MAG: AMP-binding protein [Pseudomonadota bacterium]